ncbi:MAG TPA: hypothetical protein VMV35_00860 [Halothiobacillus sp.]|nr:hypothetical protein [Halothiobacillus sp.]
MIDTVAPGFPEERAQPRRRNAYRVVVFSVIALLIAVSILLQGTPRPYDEQLIHIQAEQTLAPIDLKILNEPADLQALLLSYDRPGDNVLLLKAAIALHTYPDWAPDIFTHYGVSPEFQAILRRYGEAIIPVIHYFMINDVFAIQAQQALGNTIQSTTESARKLWNSLSGKGDAPPPTTAAPKPVENTPESRGWYAIRQIEADGHDLLGQFVIDKNGQVSRIQTKRITQDVGDFLTSGLVNIEKKSDTGESMSTSDYFFAATDAVFFAAAFKLLKAGKSVATADKEVALAGKTTNSLKAAPAAKASEMGLVKRTRIFGASLIPRFPVLAKMGMWGAVIATTYVIVRHPSLINSLLAGVAHTLGMAPWIVQLVGWFLIISLLLSLLSGLLNLVWRPVRLSFRLARGTRRMLIAVFIRSPRPESTAGTTPDQRH